MGKFEMNFPKHGWSIVMCGLIWGYIIVTLFDLVWCGLWYVWQVIKDVWCNIVPHTMPDVLLIWGGFCCCCKLCVCVCVCMHACVDIWFCLCGLVCDGTMGASFVVAMVCDACFVQKRLVGHDSWFLFGLYIYMTVQQLSDWNNSAECSV